MKVTRGYLPLSGDAQCAWEAAGREATTFGTGPNGPVCLFIGLLQLSRGRVADLLHQHTRLTPDSLRQALRDGNGEEGKRLNLAMVRDRAEATAHRAGRGAITPEYLLEALAGDEVLGTRLHRALTRADPSLDLGALHRALSVSGSPRED